jgi:DNA-binding NtrC family response regulator
VEKVDGMEVLSRAKERSPDDEVIMLTGLATVNSAIEPMKRGAFHYVPKPYRIEEVRGLVGQALKKKRLKEEIKALKQDLRVRAEMPFIIGKDRKIPELLETVRRIAPTDCDVLIMGETGTGKELIAQAIHQASGRADGRFVAFS